MSARTDCPACAGTDLSPLYRVDAIPVQSCILLDSEAEARDFPRADLSLVFCRNCGFVFNEIFESALVDYAATTEESQHFSGTFNRFAATLIDEIVEAYDLAGRWTLEIGCGKGDFLEALVDRTGTRALGVDPGYLEDRSHRPRSGVGYLKEYFDPERIDVSPDFVVCRHTLEHIPDVARFLSDIRALIDDRAGVGLFFETPDAGRVLAEGAFQDIYYEHCSYFTPGTHARLFRAAGIDVTRVYLAYDGQYIIQHARTGAGTPPGPAEEDLSRLERFAAAFPDLIAARRARWSSFVRDRHRAGRRVAIWGGGSKCVSFLTSNGLGEEVSDVVDINPHKQGRYLPGTGHRVIGPEDLIDAPPDTVIVMNPIYLPEVAADLSRLGIGAELRAP